jgi:hypothetical protein
MRRELTKDMMIWQLSAPFMVAIGSAETIEEIQDLILGVMKITQQPWPTICASMTIVEKEFNQREH